MIHDKSINTRDCKREQIHNNFGRLVVKSRHKEFASQARKTIEKSMDPADLQDSAHK